MLPMMMMAYDRYDRCVECLSSLFSERRKNRQSCDLYGSLTKTGGGRARKNEMTWRGQLVALVEEDTMRLVHSLPLASFASTHSHTHHTNITLCQVGYVCRGGCPSEYCGIVSTSPHLVLVAIFLHQLPDWICPRWSFVLVLTFMMVT